MHTPANAAADTTCAASSTAILPSLTTRVTARAASPVLAAHDEVAPRQAVEVCIQPAQLSTRNMCTEFSGRSLLVASMNALMPPTESSDKKGQDDLESENLPLKQYLCVCVCARPCASHPRTLPYINSQILANRYIIVPLLLQPSASSSTIARLPPSSVPSSVSHAHPPPHLPHYLHLTPVQCQCQLHWLQERPGHHGTPGREVSCVGCNKAVLSLCPA